MKRLALASLRYWLFVFATVGLGLGVSGCSDGGGGGGGKNSLGGSDTDVIRGVLGEGEDAEFTSEDGPTGPGEGEFAVRGRNIRYDTELGALIVDLSIVNLSEESYPEPVAMTFASLIPEGVTVLNPDNEENGPGAAIEFQFENDDGEWTPEEESLPRETQFGVEQGVSIGFVARIDVGMGGDGLGSIGGLVWDDQNGDGVMDEDEPGLAGATVELSAEGVEPATTTTAEDGTYRFDGLASGLYEVIKQPAEGFVATTPRMIEVILVEDDAGQVVPFLAANFGCMEDDGTMGAIGGVVYEDLNEDGVRDEGEPGIAGVIVGLAGADDGVTPAVIIKPQGIKTNEQGEYLFDGLAAGSYKVFKVPSDQLVPTTPTSVGVTLKEVAGKIEQALDVDFGCKVDEGASGSIEGVVWNDANANGEMDEGEKGLRGVTIALTGETIDDRSLESGLDGGFEFEGLVVGTYNVRKMPTEGLTPTTPTSIEVILAEGDDGVADFTEANFGCTSDAVSPMGSIGGFVFNDANLNKIFDKGERGIPGVPVALTGGEGFDGQALKTDVRGQYLFDGLEAGSYTVTKTEVEGFIPTTPTSIDVTPAPGEGDVGIDDVFDANFGCASGGDVGPMGAIGGLVFNDANENGEQDEGEEGVPGVPIALMGDQITGAEVKTDANGLYLFDALPAGVYAVVKMGVDGMMPTTATKIEVMLDEGGEVVDADFGCKVGDATPDGDAIQVGDCVQVEGFFVRSPSRLVADTIMVDGSDNGDGEPGGPEPKSGRPKPSSSRPKPSSSNSSSSSSSSSDGSSGIDCSIGELCGPVTSLEVGDIVGIGGTRVKIINGGKSARPRSPLDGIHLGDKVCASIVPPDGFSESDTLDGFDLRTMRNGHGRLRGFVDEIVRNDAGEITGFISLNTLVTITDGTTIGD